MLGEIAAPYLMWVAGKEQPGNAELYVSSSSSSHSFPNYCN